MSNTEEAMEVDGESSKVKEKEVNDVEMTNDDDGDASNEEEEEEEEETTPKRPQTAQERTLSRLSAGMEMRGMMTESYTCKECNASFTRKSKLDYHVANAHPKEPEVVEPSPKRGRKQKNPQKVHTPTGDRINNTPQKSPKGQKPLKSPKMSMASKPLELSKTPIINRTPIKLNQPGNSLPYIQKSISMKQVVSAADIKANVQKVLERNQNTASMIRHNKAQKVTTISNEKVKYNWGYYCTACDMYFANMFAQQFHCLHGQAKFRCEACCICFKLRKNFMSHVQMVHGVDIPEEVLARMRPRSEIRAKQDTDGEKKETEVIDLTEDSKDGTDKSDTDKGKEKVETESTKPGKDKEQAETKSPKLEPETTKSGEDEEKMVNGEGLGMKKTEEIKGEETEKDETKSEVKADKKSETLVEQTKSEKTKEEETIDETKPEIKEDKKSEAKVEETESEKTKEETKTEERKDEGTKMEDSEKEAKMPQETESEKTKTEGPKTEESKDTDDEVVLVSDSSKDAPGKPKSVQDLKQIESGGNSSADESEKKDEGRVYLTTVRMGNTYVTLPSGEKWMIECLRCHQAFFKMEDASMHMRQKPGSEFTCPHCQYSSTLFSQCDYEIHRLRTHSFPCAQCRQSFILECQRNMHERKIHNYNRQLVRKKTDSSQMNSDKRPSVISVGPSSKPVGNKGVYSVSGKQRTPFVCLMCDRDCYTSNALEHHKRTFHAAVYRPQSAKSIHPIAKNTVINKLGPGYMNSSGVRSGPVPVNRMLEEMRRNTPQKPLPQTYSAQMNAIMTNPYLEPNKLPQAYITRIKVTLPDANKLVDDIRNELLKGPTSFAMPNYAKPSKFNKDMVTNPNVVKLSREVAYKLYFDLQGPCNPTDKMNYRDPEKVKYKIPMGCHSHKLKDVPLFPTLDDMTFRTNNYTISPLNTISPIEMFSRYQGLINLEDSAKFSNELDNVMYGHYTKMMRSLTMIYTNRRVAVSEGFWRLQTKALIAILKDIEDQRKKEISERAKSATEAAKAAAAQAASGRPIKLNKVPEDGSISVVELVEQALGSSPSTSASRQSEEAMNLTKDGDSESGSKAKDGAAGKGGSNSDQTNTSGKVPTLQSLAKKASGKEDEKKDGKEEEKKDGKGDKETKEDEEDDGWIEEGTEEEKKETEEQSKKEEPSTEEEKMEVDGEDKKEEQKEETKDQKEEKEDKKKGEEEKDGENEQQEDNEKNEEKEEEKMEENQTEGVKNDGLVNGDVSPHTDGDGPGSNGMQNGSSGAPSPANEPVSSDLKASKGASQDSTRDTPVDPSSNTNGNGLLNGSMHTANTTLGNTSSGSNTLGNIAQNGNLFFSGNNDNGKVFTTATRMMQHLAQNNGSRNSGFSSPGNTLVNPGTINLNATVNSVNGTNGFNGSSGVINVPMSGMMPIPVRIGNLPNGQLGISGFGGSPQAQNVIGQNAIGSGILGARQGGFSLGGGGLGGNFGGSSVGGVLRSTGNGLVLTLAPSSVPLMPVPKLATTLGAVSAVASVPNIPAVHLPNKRISLSVGNRVLSPTTTPKPAIPSKISQFVKDHFVNIRPKGTSQFMRVNPKNGNNPITIEAMTSKQSSKQPASDAKSVEQNNPVATLLNIKMAPQLSESLEDPMSEDTMMEDPLVTKILKLTAALKLLHNGKVLPEELCKKIIPICDKITLPETPFEDKEEMADKLHDILKVESKDALRLLENNVNMGENNNTIPQAAGEIPVVMEKFLIDLTQRIKNIQTRLTERSLDQPTLDAIVPLCQNICDPKLPLKQKVECIKEAEAKIEKAEEGGAMRSQASTPVNVPDTESKGDVADDDTVVHFKLHLSNGTSIMVDMESLEGAFEAVAGSRKMQLKIKRLKKTDVYKIRRKFRRQRVREKAKEDKAQEAKGREAESRVAEAQKAEAQKAAAQKAAAQKAEAQKAAAQKESQEAEAQVSKGKFNQSKASPVKEATTFPAQETEESPKKESKASSTIKEKTSLTHEAKDTPKKSPPQKVSQLKESKCTSKNESKSSPTQKAKSSPSKETRLSPRKQAIPYRDAKSSPDKNKAQANLSKSKPKISLTKMNPDEFKNKEEVKKGKTGK